jgi:hypothetical protein
LAFFVYPGDPVRAGLSAACGFGIAHVPAAFILAFKQFGGSRKS